MVRQPEKYHTDGRRYCPTFPYRLRQHSECRTVFHVAVQVLGLTPANSNDDWGVAAQIWNHIYGAILDKGPWFAHEGKHWKDAWKTGGGHSRPKEWDAIKKPDVQQPADEMRRREVYKGWIIRAARELNITLPVQTSCSLHVNNIPAYPEVSPAIQTFAEKQQEKLAKEEDQGEDEDEDEEESDHQTVSYPKRAFASRETAQDPDGDNIHVAMHAPPPKRLKSASMPTQGYPSVGNNVCQKGKRLSKNVISVENDGDEAYQQALQNSISDMNSRRAQEKQFSTPSTLFSSFAGGDGNQIMSDEDFARDLDKKERRSQRKTTSKINYGELESDDDEANFIDIFSSGPGRNSSATTLGLFTSNVQDQADAAANIGGTLRDKKTEPAKYFRGGKPVPGPSAAAGRKASKLTHAAAAAERKVKKSKAFDALDATAPEMSRTRKPASGGATAFLSSATLPKNGTGSLKAAAHVFEPVVKPNTPLLPLIHGGNEETTWWVGDMPATTTPPEGSTLRAIQDIENPMRKRGGLVVRGEIDFVQQDAMLCVAGECGWCDPTGVSNTLGSVKGLRKLGVPVVHDCCVAVDDATNVKTFMHAAGIGEETWKKPLPSSYKGKEEVMFSDGVARTVMVCNPKRCDVCQGIYAAGGGMQ